MAVTSQISRATTSSDEVPIDQWREAGLLKPSFIKPGVATIENGLVLRRLGSLQPTDVQALRAAMGRVFG
jgi:mRNA interferase MazF